MKIAIMQPYFFPYIGYYQLVNSVDEFVFYDDVNFIKKGYINRNTIINNKAPLKFSIPIKNISQFKKINEHTYINDFKKLRNMVFFSYKKSPFFEKIFNMIEEITSTNDMNVAILNSRTIISIFDYLKIEKKFSFSSTISIPEEEKGQKRILSICKKKSCTFYHNPIGGKTLNLYQPSFFSEAGINLRFIKRNEGERHAIFHNNFSMIDILMNYPPEEIIEHLNAYELII